MLKNHVSRGSISTFDPFLLGAKVEVCCARALLRMPDSKGGRISREIKKSIARAGWRLLREKP